MGQKLLFYTNALSGGGAEIVFARLAEALAADGHAVTFAADYLDDTTPYPKDVDVVRLPSNHIAATYALSQLLRQSKYDASFSALGSHNLKHVAAAAFAGRLKRCVLGIHGFAAAETQLMSRISFWLTPLLTRLSAKTICVSDVLKQDMISRWHARADRLERVYNPVSTIPMSSLHKSDPPLVVACGRLVGLKRFPDLVRAFALVSRHDARLAILGTGPDRAAIEATIKEHGLGHRVEMPGHVDPSLWYPKASCLVVSSESESFGLTIAEALAFGVPVVSTDCGGPREILQDGRIGELVPVGDVVAMGAAITRALMEPGDPVPRLERAKAFSLPVISRTYAELATNIASA